MQNYKKYLGKFLVNDGDLLILLTVFNRSISILQQTFYEIPVTKRSMVFPKNFTTTAEGISSSDINAKSKVNKPILDCLEKT